MVRRAWVLCGVTGLGIVAFASAFTTSDDIAAKAVTTPPDVTVAPAELPPTTPAVTEPASTTTEPAPTTTEPAPTTTEPPPTTPAADPSTTVQTTTTVDQRSFNAAAFDAVISAATVDAGDVSAGVAVMRNGGVLHSAAFGMQDPLALTPATIKTRFRLASVSKMFTAVAIMQLVHEGSVKLDEPFAPQLGLNGLFPDPRIGTITVRQLLSHTSGFGTGHGLYFGRGVETWQQAASVSLGQPLKSDPGTAYLYSNTNFCILGLMIEAITGDPFETAIRERVLGPAGITAHLAPTIDTDPGDAVHVSSPGRNYMEALGPAGGWVATPTDVAKLAATLRNDPSALGLDDAAVEAMRVPVPVPVETPSTTGWSYGLGLILFNDGAWGHTGTIESTHALVANRADGLTVSLLISGNRPSNTDRLVPLIDLAVAAAYGG